MNTKDVCKIHDILYHIALIFKEICEKYNLTYFIAYGSLLGAVREGDIIQWDDDMDFVMPRKDYEVFARVVHRELDSLETSLIAKDFFSSKYNFPKPWIRIEDVGTKVYVQKDSQTIKYDSGVFVDIFPLDGAFSNPFLQKIHIKIIQYTMLIWWYIMYRDPKKTKSFCNKILLYILRFFFKNNFGYRIVQKILALKKYQTAKFARSYFWDNRGILPKEVYGTPSLVKLRDTFFCAPSNPHEYLSHFYDDYMIPRKDSGHHQHVDFDI